MSGLTLAKLLDAKRIMDEAPQEDLKMTMAPWAEAHLDRVQPGWRERGYFLWWSEDGEEYKIELVA